MGQVVEDMLEGLVCQECGEWMDDFEAPGYPRTCAGCAPQRAHSRHIANRRDERPARIACPVCLQLPKADRARRMFFPSTAAMEAHVQALHPTLTCDLCDRTFKGEIALRQHRTMKHGESA